MTPPHKPRTWHSGRRRYHDSNNPTPNLPAQEEMVEDFEVVRDNTKNLIKDAMVAVNELMQIAGYSQDHKVIRLLALLMKTALQANRDLVDLAV